MDTLRFRRVCSRFGLFLGLATCYAPPFVPFTLFAYATADSSAAADAIEARVLHDGGAFGWLAIEPRALLALQLAFIVFAVIFDASTPERADGLKHPRRRTAFEILRASGMILAVLGLLSGKTISIVHYTGFNGGHDIVEGGGFWNLPDLWAAIALIALGAAPRFVSVEPYVAWPFAALSAAIAAHCALGIANGDLASIPPTNTSDAGVLGGTEIGGYGLLFDAVAGGVIAIWYVGAALGLAQKSAADPARSVK